MKASARSPRAPRTRAIPKRHWTRLSDEELLHVRFCDLDISLQRSPLRPYIRQLNHELQRAGIEFRPHLWLSEEWFSPDGVPGIAVPFYLAHPRLRRLERRMMREVEGGNANWLMRILRHEAGHALDTAYRLRRRRRWREVFGPASLPYPDSYRPRAGSRRYVQHLGAWYAQCHPTEDFAETFAVWLRPSAHWRRVYRNWPALEKLEYVDELMGELRGTQARVRQRRVVEPLSTDRRTLGEHYRERLARHAAGRARVVDNMLRRAFQVRSPGTRQHLRATTYVRSLKTVLRRDIANRLDVSEYLVHQVLRLILHRCDVLRLQLRSAPRHARARVERLVLRIVRLHIDGSAGRHTL
jgi:hypothetical protein